MSLSAEETLERLKKGNEEYLRKRAYTGDVSAEICETTDSEGQNPYAVIIGCSDSRAIPEVIFNAGVGELFVIRVAGNVIDDHQLGSIEYAADHLHTKLVVVLGHTNCGAVAAALKHSRDGHIKYIVDDIRDAVGNEKAADKACRLNVIHSVKMIERDLDIQKLESKEGLRIVGAVYDLKTGKVGFLDHNEWMVDRVLVDALKNLSESTDWDIETCMDNMKIPKEQREAYKAEVARNI